MKVFEVVLEDGTGAVKLVWFNQGFLGDQIRRGDRLAVFGTPKISSYGQLQIESADWEKFEGDDEADGAIVPIYSKVGNIPPKALRQIIGGALDALPSLDDPLAAGAPQAPRRDRSRARRSNRSTARRSSTTRSSAAARARTSASSCRSSSRCSSRCASAAPREEVKTKTRKINVDDEHARRGANGSCRSG